jgi:hypothetical protein
MKRAKVRPQHPLAGPRQRGGARPPPPLQVGGALARSCAPMTAGLPPPPGHEARTSAPPASSGRPQAEGGSAGEGGDAGKSASECACGIPDKGGEGGMRARRCGTRAKRALSAHTQLSRPRSPPQARGGKSRLVQNPRQSPQAEGEGGKRPRGCGTRAKRALCAHTA